MHLTEARVAYEVPARHTNRVNGIVLANCARERHVCRLQFVFQCADASGVLFVFLERLLQLLSQRQRLSQQLLVTGGLDVETREN